MEAQTGEGTVQVGLRALRSRGGSPTQVRDNARRGVTTSEVDALTGLWPTPTLRKVAVAVLLGAALASGCGWR